LDSTLAEVYQDLLSDRNGAVTYKVFRHGWFVVSGKKDGQIFYQKTVTTDKAIATVLIDYPETDGLAFAHMVGKLGSSLQLKGSQEQR
jgi:hypothetical protein